MVIFSPKNILLGKKYPVILDAETACWGNPAFLTLAFLITTLFLKVYTIKKFFKSYLRLVKIL